MGTPPDTLPLERAGLELRLVRHPEDGLVLADLPGHEPLVWLVNRLATGDVQPVPDDVALDDESLRELGSLVEPLDGDILRVFSPWGTEEVERDVLWACLDTLMERRLTEPFWQFRPDPVFWRPSPADRELASQLEPEARSLDGETADSPRAHERRILVLAQLEAAGVLEPEHARARSRWLREWGCDTLLGYQESAAALSEYGRSPERARVFAGLARPLPARPHVSLDWFRHPPGEIGDATRTAICEEAVVGHAAAGLPSGQVFVEQDGIRYVLDWRREDGVTAVLVTAHRLD